MTIQLAPADEVVASAAQAQPLVLIVAAVCGGMIVDRVIDFPMMLYLAAGGVALAIWLVLYRFGCFKTSSWVLLLAWASLAGLWHQGQWNWFPADDLQAYAHPDSTLVCAKVKIRSEPRIVAAKATNVLNPIPPKERTLYLSHVIAIRQGRTWIPVSGAAELIIHERIDHLRCGDEVEVFGRLVAADGPRNPGQNNFRTPCRRDRRLAKLHAFRSEGVVLHGQSSRSILPWARAWLRSKLSEAIERHIPTERSALASAILLGNRDQLNLKRRHEFFLSGTVHLLAISGLHIGILAGVFFMFYRIGLLPRSPALFFTIAFAIFFAWLVEFRPPVLRATVLIVLFCLARILGRNGWSYNLLSLAAIIVLIINPADLFQIGPQLSFLAVGAMVGFQRWTDSARETDPLQRLIDNTRGPVTRMRKWVCRRIVLAFQVSAMIALVTMPLVALNFHLVAPVGLLLNPLVLLPMAFALYAGLAVLVFGSCWGWAADQAGWICDRSLSMIESLVRLGQEIPGSCFWTSGPNELSVGCFYFLLWLLGIYPPTRVSGRWLLTSFLIWLVVGWVGPDWLKTQSSRSSTTLEVFFVDSGHGGSVLLKLPRGQAVVFDAGCLGSAEYGAANISAVLWHQHVMHIDALIISHADVDHFNSAVELVRRFSVGVVYLSPMMQKSTSEAVQCFLQELEIQEIEVRNLVSGKRLVIDSKNVSMNVHAPPIQGVGETDNSNSIVLSIEAMGKKILLTGDLEGPGLTRLLSIPLGDFDVVMAPHHGSHHSEPEKFVRWANPKHVIVSASRRRIDWRAIETFGEAQRQVWITGRDGAIRCRVSPDGLEVANWIHGDPSGSRYYSQRGFEHD